MSEGIAEWLSNCGLRGVVAALEPGGSVCGRQSDRPERRDITEGTLAGITPFLGL